MSAALRPFHLAVPVDDLDAAVAFYCKTLGCSTGRTSTRWVDLDFFGHQVTLHRVDDDSAGQTTNPVDGDNVPVRHFGVVLDMADWRDLAARLQTAGAEFLIAPRIRFEGQVGEQATMFLLDPSDNALEFKSFADPEKLFAT